MNIESAYPTPALGSVDVIITDPTEIDILQHGLDPLAWGPIFSPNEKEKAQKELLDWILETLLPNYPKIKAEWFVRLSGKKKGDVDLLIWMLINGKWYVVLHIEILNWWRCSKGDPSRPKNYKYNLNMAAKAGDIRVHPRCQSVLILCGGHPNHLYLHHEREWTMFRFPEPIYPNPTEEQKRWALRTIKRALDMAMSVNARSLCNNNKEGSDGGLLDTTITTETTVDSCVFDNFHRFSGSGSAERAKIERHSPSCPSFGYGSVEPCDCTVEVIELNSTEYAQTRFDDFDGGDGR